MPSYFIKPIEPTVLSHKEYHELSSTNLLLSLVFCTMHVIPELLDVDRFNVALAEALSSFPLLAGRLVRPGTSDAPWAIRLTNSGIPVKVVDSDADEIFPTDLAVQPTPLHTDPLNAMGIISTEGESSEPLFRLTITRFTKLNTTSIAAANSHVLFDLTGYLMFFKQLSQLYQGLGPIDPPPYYESEAIEFAEPLKAPSPLYDRFNLSDPSLWEEPKGGLPEFVTFRLTDAQLTEIRNSVTKGVEDSRITRMDTLVGLLARCLSDIEPESKPVDTISYLVNHRGMGIYPANAVVNATVFLQIGLQPSKELDPRDEVLASAVEIRKSLEGMKDPKSLIDMVTYFANVQSQTSWDKSGQGPPREGCLFVNALRRADWKSAHFGHPGKTKFHIDLPPCRRFLGVTTPNPKFVDGKWVSRDNEVDVAFYVPPNKRKMFEVLLEGYVKGMGMTGQVEFLP